MTKENPQSAIRNPQSPISSPLLCSECGRANSLSANRCLWCGAPIMSGGVPPILEPTQADLDYIGGLERLHDPTAVRVTISEAGIEITETMPGSRKIMIDASAVVDARVTDGGKVLEERALRQPWWRRLSRSLSHTSRDVEIPRAESRGYTLTIRYRDNDDVLSAVFRRQGSTGLLMVQGLARAVASMVHLRLLQSESPAKES